MNQTSVYNYLRDVALNAEPDAKFFQGRAETLTLTTFENDKSIFIFLFPFVSRLSFTPIGQQVNQEYVIRMFFLKQDRMGSEIDQNDQEALQTEMQIVRDMQEVAGRYYRLINYNNFTSDLESKSDLVDIGQADLSEVIKDNDYLLSGAFLTFPMRVPDDFNYCA